MALVVGDRIEVKFYCQAQDQIGLNVRHYEVTAVTSPPLTQQDTAKAISLAFSTIYKNVVAAEARYYGAQILLYSGGGAGFTPYAESKEGLGAGNETGGMLPRQTSGLIKLGTGFAGRANRGRAYVPFPAEDDNSTNATPAIGYLLSIQQLADGFLLAAGLPGVDNPARSISLAGLLYHRALGTFTPLTSADARDKWATQRRRGSYGRPNAAPF